MSGQRLAVGALLGCALVARVAVAGEDAPARSETVVIAPPEPAAAPPPKKAHRLEWNERWHRFRLVEYVATGATGAGSIALFAFATSSSHPKWVGPILFDGPVRDAFHLHTRSGILAAEAAGSALSVVLPIQSMIDSVGLPALAGNFDLMWQLGMMDAESYALSGLVTAGTYDIVGRARPSYLDCKSGRSIDPYCSSGEFASFPSGHMAVAMTAAGLICAHHGALPLYGGKLDVAACVEGLTLATADGVLRLMADRHYFSDVFVGGAIGFFSGYALPELLHYWKRPLGEVVNRADLKASVLPGAGGVPLSLGLVGIF